MKLFNKVTLATSLIVSQLAWAQPTPAQIEQFKKLPKAQQEQLARQYGVDLNALNAGSASSQPQQPVAAPEKTMPTPTPEAPAKEIKQSTELTAFGYDVLKGIPDTFTTFDSIPVPNDYIIGPGDEIRIQMFGKEDGEELATVDRNGQISLPRIGPVSVAGKSFSQVNAELTALIQERIIGGNVLVSMGNMRMMQVFITGEATQPGAYNVSGVTTLTQALIAAGGVKETGSLREVQLKREGKVVAILDLYDLLLNGDSSQDVRLEKGDTLFIPAKKSTVTISGEVLRAAHFELVEPTPLSEVIDYAGGTKAAAYLGTVSVRRQTQSGIVVDTVDLNKSSGRNFKIQDGDEIFISKANQYFVNAVGVRGQATRQGVHEFKVGMRVSDIFKSIDKDLRAGAELDYALIVREKSLRGEVEVLQFSLRKAITKPNSKDDVVLNNRDHIFILSNNVDSEFWYGRGSQSEATLEMERLTQAQEQRAEAQRNARQGGQEQTTVDAQTGAVTENSPTQNEEGQAKVSEIADSNQLSHRAKELEPIIERLKEQSHQGAPVQLVEITGDVKYPGIYPLTKGMETADLIVAAGGLLESAFVSQAELTRFNSGNYEDETTALSHQRIDLSALLAGNPDASPRLHSKDRLIIFKKPTWQSEMVVELQGEVMFPGSYAVNRGDTIRDLVERAGGLTEFAYPDGAVYARERLKLREQQQMQFLRGQLEQQIAGLTLRKNSSSASFSSSPTEAMQLVQNLTSTPALGRMVIDMPAILNGDDEADVVLANKDKLFIPEYEKTVSIIGEVQFTSTHTFDNSKTVDDYLNLAGGTNKQADTDRVYVVRADGSVMIPNNSYWFSRSSESLQPGDTIIVPVDVDYLDGLSTITSATQILYQLGVAWSAIKD
ncbi:SLBB domain-containing protein [Vibrio agarivorans]|uniref:SLBB domain-containing protein n=1 Tax=Vibrio agarivorans TaxID=153622 RepID=UPI0025B6080E|nr:SLBB domain-containing protein [Vibrio agarivorans]MDN3662186.1 SLBB domain-containing protein [Vibrio agarivorans]